MTPLVFLGLIVLYYVLEAINKFMPWEVIEPSYLFSWI